MRINGSTFIVTGGASGLGAATARELLERGANVGIADLADPPLEVSSRALYRRIDVRDEDQVGTLIADVLEQFGRLDGVVNCAGIGVSARVLGREGGPPARALPEVPGDEPRRDVQRHPPGGSGDGRGRARHRR